ncbi:MAG: WYL domain-containing protein [Lachnospiraceae bacterium]|nr:WYL domain-containing protein [Lachnospiraceae bacterium]
MTARERFKDIRDFSLRITFQLLDILITEPHKYDLEDLSIYLGCNVGLLCTAITECLYQNIFEFYIGNTRITPDNCISVLKYDNGEKLAVVSRIAFTDKTGFKKYRVMKEKFEGTISEKKNFEKIVAFNSYRVDKSLNRIGVDPSVMQSLSEGKTSEYKSSITGSRFFPIAVYTSLQYRREYFVALEKGYQLKFYPCEDSVKCDNTTMGKKNEKPFSEICDNTDVIPDALEKLKYIWGPHDMFLDEEQFSVSAVIYDKSCLGKILHDISNKPYKLKDNKDGTYSLKMEILGYDAFRIWVLSYGSSIEIKEPVRLRKELREVYEKIKNGNA